MPSSSPHAFVLAGGRGTRFWPLSRKKHPKQLLDFTGEGSLLACTLERISAVIPPERQWILTGEDLVDAVADCAPGIDRSRIIAEPVGRNTAPAVGLAAAILEEHFGDEAFVILPSDHLITPVGIFQDNLRLALDTAQDQDLLLTFGIVPTRAETGYGYIESGDSMPGVTGVRKVDAFRDKPDLVVAEKYLQSGRHFWNSGMFAWRASTVRRGLEEHAPEILAPVLEIAGAGRPGTPGFQKAFTRVFPRISSISIDYALMEKAENVGMIQAGFSWNDVGHWVAMRDLWPQDEDGNAYRGKVIPIESRGNVVYGPDRLTALVGVEDLIVVNTEDATLICRADQAQKIRSLLERLDRENLEEFL